MNIIVTGASRGIGYQAALKFAADPGNSVLVLSRNERGLKALERECLDRHPASRLLIHPFDLENLEAIAGELGNYIMELFDRVDILVNNAGLLVKKPIMKLNPEDVNRMMTVNFTAPMVLIRTLIPLLERAGASHVVNIGSMAGVQGSRKFMGLSAYSATKAALHILTECLAVEFAEAGVHFNALALGSVQTEMLGEAFPGLQAPLKDSEMAEFVYDFALNGKKYFNGKTIPVALSTP
jgi:NAD(P)-dependent dehydrogenase (short-subunit alcohol dehydrogenase family)